MNYYDIKTTSDYEAYVKAIADSIVEDAVGRLKEINDDEPIDVEGIEGCISYHGIEHEHIDADGIIIYYGGHNIIMEHTDNEDYLTENVGICEINSATSWTQTKQYFAYWAFYGDVMRYLDEAIKEAYEKARWDRLEEAYEAQLHSHWQAGGRE